MKPWRLGAAGLVILAVAGFLWTRSARPREEAPASPTRPVSNPPARDARPSPALGAASPVVNPDGPGKPGEAVLVAASAPQSTEPPTSWEQIPLDRASGESLGNLQTRNAFSSAMRQRPALSRCTEEWMAPPEIRRLEMELELRVRSVDDALLVEDVIVLEANVSDASVERCVISELRGRRAPAPGIQPGQAFRIKWGATKYLK